MQRLDISELYEAEDAPAHEGTAFWEALQNVEVLNLKMGKLRNSDGVPYSEVKSDDQYSDASNPEVESGDQNSDGSNSEVESDEESSDASNPEVESDDQNSDSSNSEVNSDDEIDPVAPCFFQSISLMTRLR